MIIFNSWQTADLLKNGKTHGRGKLIGARALAKGTLSVDPMSAFAHGTAYSGMPAHASTNTGGAFKFRGSAVNVTGSNNTVNIGTKGSGEGANAGNNSEDSADDKNFSYEVFDYVEIRLKYFADQTKKIADRITDYISYATRKSQLKKETKALQKEIEVNSRAATTYMAKANSIWHDYVYTDDSGKSQSLDLANVFNQADLIEGKYDLANMETSTAEQKAYIEGARAYIDYYNKANDANNAIIELTNTMRELYDQIIQIPSEKLDKTLEKINAIVDVFDTGADAISSGGSALNSLQKYIDEANVNGRDLTKYSLGGKTYDPLARAKAGNANAPVWHTQNKLELESLKKQREAYQETVKAADEQRQLSIEFVNQRNASRAELDKQAAQLNGANLSKEQRDAIAAKQIINPSFVPEELADAVAKYNEICKRWQSDFNATNQAQEQESDARLKVAQTAAELAKAEQESIKNMIDNLDAFYENLIKYNKTLGDEFAKDRELWETVGRSFATGSNSTLANNPGLQKNYEDQITRMAKVRDAYYEESEKMQENLDKRVREGLIINGSEEWKELTQRIQEQKNNGKDAQIEIEKLWDSMVNDVHLRPLEEAIEKIKILRENVAMLQGLITDDMKFTMTGDYTDWGIAHLMADMNTLNRTRDELSYYIREQDEMKKLNQENKISDEEYVTRMDEINKKTQETVKASYAARQSVIKTIQDRYQTELNYINKLIDARKKELSKQKEIANYDRGIKKSQKQVQLLQQQIRAINGLSDAESKAQKARFEAQLEEQKEQLDEQIQQHIVEMRVEGLDKISEQLQENYENYVKDLAINLDRGTEIINKTAQNISGKVDTTNQLFQTLLQSFNTGLNLLSVGVESFTKSNINPSTNPHYATTGFSSSAQQYITPTGSVFQLSDSLPQVTPELYSLASAGTQNVVQSSIQKAVNAVNKVPNYISAYGSNNYGSLVSITVEGNLDKTVVPSINQIANNLLKDRTFTSSIAQQTSKSLSKDLRKTGY